MPLQIHAIAGALRDVVHSLALLLARSGRRDAPEAIVVELISPVQQRSESFGLSPTQPVCEMGRIPLGVLKQHRVEFWAGETSLAEFFPESSSTTGLELVNELKGMDNTRRKCSGQGSRDRRE